MLVKQIRFKDYDGNERTETHYFNMEKNELIELEISSVGGLEESVKRIIQARRGKEIMDTFKDIILKSYGEKDLDGVHFNKSEELSNRFYHSKAYDALFMELVTDDNAAAEFINKILPDDINVDNNKVEEIKKEMHLQ